MPSSVARAPRGWPNGLELGVWAALGQEPASRGWGALEPLGRGNRVLSTRCSLPLWGGVPRVRKGG